MASSRPAAWGSVLRSALLFTPFFAASLAIFLYIVRDALKDGFGAGLAVGLVLSGGVAALLGYQLIQAVRDLSTSLVETEGQIERHWSRNEFFIMRNTYIFVERSVFRIEPEQEHRVETGDTVRITHYPHTGAVESVELVERGARVEK